VTGFVGARLGRQGQVPGLRLKGGHLGAANAFEGGAQVANAALRALGQCAHRRTRTLACVPGFHMRQCHRLAGRGLGGKDLRHGGFHGALGGWRFVRKHGELAPPGAAGAGGRVPLKSVVRLGHAAPEMLDSDQCLARYLAPNTASLLE